MIVVLCVALSLYLTRELADLKKASAASDNAIKVRTYISPPRYSISTVPAPPLCPAQQEATLSAEMSAKEELKATLEQHRREALQEKDQLLLQVRNSVHMWTLRSPLAHGKDRPL